MSPFEPFSRARIIALSGKSLGDQSPKPAAWAKAGMSGPAGARSPGGTTANVACAARACSRSWAKRARRRRSLRSRRGSPFFLFLPLMAGSAVPASSRPSQTSEAPMRAMVDPTVPTIASRDDCRPFWRHRTRARALSALN